MSDLIEKIRKARESTIETGGWKLTIRRPTDEEAFTMRAESPADVAGRFVVGWNAKECDLFEGGSEEIVPFSADLWREVIADRIDLWVDITKAVRESYEKHAKEIAEKAKN